MSSECPGKNWWPELLGTKGDFAVSVIERENPNVNAMMILDGIAVTGDFRCDRVRVMVNRKHIVVETPRTG